MADDAARHISQAKRFRRSRRAHQGRRPLRSTGGDRNEDLTFVARRRCSGAFVPGQSHRLVGDAQNARALDLRRDVHAAASVSGSLPHRGTTGGGDQRPSTTALVRGCCGKSRAVLVAAGVRWGASAEALSAGRARLSQVGMGAVVCRQSFRRLCVAAIRRHSERAADLPRRWKRSQRRLNFVSAKTGSIMPWRLA